MEECGSTGHSPGGVAPGTIARRFHDTVAAMVVEAALKVRAATGLDRVALSGGTWHNRYLLGVVVCLLRQKGFTVFYHRQVPPGDGGLALGQAVIGHIKKKGTGYF
ncbi:MAG: hypothetical protein IMW93_02525 [Thermoanaerobacteraceae bacterium]|nr:hypothetical protein [Thermoanaerobacteraceae bacterium]